MNPLSDKRIEEEENLKSKLGELIWAGQLWGSDGAISLAKQLPVPASQAEKIKYLSALSSLYYTAYGNASSQLMNSRGLKTALWRFRRGVTRRKMLRFSYELLRASGGIANLNAEELDIRASILRSMENHDEALEVVREAMSRKNLSINNKVLLEIGLAESLYALGDTGEAAAAFKRAETGIPGAKPETKVRFFKHYAVFLKRKGEREASEKAFQSALKIAEENNFGDQLIKIKALMD
jgi:tetratricopeptide (TPR) repeat protein